MQQIKISNIEVEVIKKDIKNVHLSVNPPNGRVRIATPLFMIDEDIRLYLISKLPWIKVHQENFQKQERQSPREYVTGESIYYLGKRYIVKPIFHNKPPEIIFTNNKTIELHIKQETTAEKRQEIFSEWYRARLKEIAKPLVEKWQEKTGITINEWQIKKMKTKWGTCNIANKKVWLNLELAKKPVHCIEYIILHELLHITERHHNKQFMLLLEQNMPNWKNYKEELNNFIL